MPKVYITGEGQEARAKVAFDLNRLEITIGRNADNDLIISDDSSISGSHCVIKRVYGGYVIKDLGSSNGIYRDGVREEKILLGNGMEIHVGDSPLVFVYKKEEVMGLAREEQNPRKYVSEDDILELQNQRDGISSSASAPPPPPKKASGAPKLSTGSGSGAARAYVPPKKTYKESNSSLAFLGIIICFIVGTVGGLYLKHSQVYEGGNFLQDLNTKKIKGVWEKGE